MVKLQEYIPENKTQTIARIVDFFGFHSGMFDIEMQLDLNAAVEAEKTLHSWLADKHILYMIYKNRCIVGFLHIGYRGDLVAWIEDIYVDPIHRNQAIATEAIAIAEDLIASNPHYSAICLDVAPRNIAALKLYHKLGYNTISLVTVRKELYTNKRDQIQTIFGLEYNL